MVDYASLKNRAIIYSEPGTIKTEVVELPVSEPGPGEVLLRLEYSGVCHTDYGFCTNAFASFSGVPTAQGQVGGHEGVGEVIAQGPGVTFPEVGAKVGIKYAADACLSCDNCLEGGETTCHQTKVSGFYTPGTFQQYVLSSARYVTPIPAGITDLAAAAPLMCGGVTMYTALKRAGVKHGDWVLVAGAGGGLGHLGIQFAKAMGARVLGLDAASKESFCTEVGADKFIDFRAYGSPAELTEAIKSATEGRGARIVLMCASVQAVYDQAVDWLGFRGVLVCIGVPEGEQHSIVGAKVGPMIGNEITIFAIKSGNRVEAKECLDIVARGLVKTRYELKKMEDLTQIFEDMEHGKVIGRTVIDLR